MPTRRSLWSKIRGTRKTSEIRSGSSGKEKNGVTPQPLATLSLTPQKKRKKIEIVILVKLYVITAIRKATFQILALSQKTSVGLGNLHTGD